jgi:hypothetical protein
MSFSRASSDRFLPGSPSVTFFLLPVHFCLDFGIACLSKALGRETVVSPGGYMVLFCGDRGVHKSEYDIDVAGR